MDHLVVGLVEGISLAEEFEQLAGLAGKGRFPHGLKQFVFRHTVADRIGRPLEQVPLRGGRFGRWVGSCGLSLLGCVGQRWGFVRGGAAIERVVTGKNRSFVDQGCSDLNGGIGAGRCPRVGVRFAPHGW